MITPERIAGLSDFDRAQIQMFVTASASGRFSEWPHLRPAAAHILEAYDAATKRAEVAEKDTARLTFLEHRGSVQIELQGLSGNHFCLDDEFEGEGLREAIDAAHSQSTDKGEADGK